jgi:type II secretory pathway pseudopilin PulG
MTELLVDSVMVEDWGARSGTLSHAATRIPRQAVNTHTFGFFEAAGPVMMECIQKRFSVNYNSAMNLAPNASRGFAMAGLLVAMSVMAILMSVALPTWSRMVQREKEEELIFRGNQYARAINLYQRKFANASPATLDVLIEQHFLRKKYKDPLAPTKDGEFQLLYLNNQGTSSRGVGAGTPGSAVGSTLGTKPSGGIVGVASKNTGTSIRVFKGKTKYNEWQFVGVEQTRPPRRVQVPARALHPVSAAPVRSAAARSKAVDRALVRSQAVDGGAVVLRCAGLGSHRSETGLTPCATHRYHARSETMASCSAGRIC